MEKASLLEGGPRKAKGSAPARLCLAALVPALAAATLLLGVAVLHRAARPSPGPPCADSCRVQLVESIPEGLVFNSSVEHLGTHAAWSRLIGMAEETIHLAGMYWTLRGRDVYSDPSDWAGEDIFRQLLEARVARGLELKIAQNAAKPGENLDTEELAQAGAEVRGVNFTALLGAGILHTKLWVVDGKHFYVGSANFDWRSLTQVKEVGVLVTDCPCLAGDMAKIWEVYWALGGATTLPSSWPARLATRYNADTPLALPSVPEVYLSSSPASFCPPGREVDSDAIVKAIDAAEEFVEVSVMDYIPTTLYSRPTRFWPDIDDALRRAAIERGVRVRLLTSQWAHTRPAIARFLRSLADLSGSARPAVDIQVRIFTVPAFTPEQGKIPFGRVNHNKYMVTDKQGYIGTSNWSGDYFLTTGGVGFVFTGLVREQLAEIFARDWASAYSTPLPPARVGRAVGEGDHGLLYNHYNEL
jgi:phospholipase D3/4